MSTIWLKNLQAAANHTQRAVEAADTSEDGRLSQREIEAYGDKQDDGFATGRALEVFRNWAQYSPGGSANPTLEQIEARIDDTVAKFEANDADGNGILAGKELEKTRKRATYRALRDVVERSIPFKMGDTFYELMERAQNVTKTRYTSPADVPAELAPLFIQAANESSFQSSTLQDVFDQVDQGEVVVRELTDSRSGKQVLCVDYGAGDNTYGALFDPKSKAMTAAIKDGDFYPV